MRMDGADKTRIEGACDMTDFDRIARVGHRNADQRLLDRPANARAVSGADIPGGRRDDLVVLDLAAFDIDPMAERTARRFGRAPAATVALDRLDVPGVIEAEFAERTFRLAIKPDQLVHACEMPQHNAGAAQPLVHVEQQRVDVLPGLAVCPAG